MKKMIPIDPDERRVEYPIESRIHAGSIPQQLRQMKGALTAKQLGPIIGISHITLYRMAERRAIPSYRIGSKVLFDPTKIADWLDR